MGGCPPTLRLWTVTRIRCCGFQNSSSAEGNEANPPSRSHSQCGRKLEGGFASFMPRHGKGEDVAQELLQEHQPSDKVLCGDVSTRYDAPISNAGVAGASFSPSAAGSLTQFSTASSHLRRRDPPQMGWRSSTRQKQ